MPLSVIPDCWLLLVEFQLKGELVFIFSLVWKESLHPGHESSSGCLNQSEYNTKYQTTCTTHIYNIHQTILDKQDIVQLKQGVMCLFGSWYNSRHDIPRYN